MYKYLTYKKEPGGIKVKINVKFIYKYLTFYFLIKPYIL